LQVYISTGSLNYCCITLMSHLTALAEKFGLLPDVVAAIKGKMYCTVLAINK